MEALRTGPFEIQSIESEVTCRRCETNLDALRIARQEATGIGQAAMEDDYGVASLVALLLAESGSDQPTATEQAVTLLRLESPELRQATWWGLRLTRPRQVESLLRALLGRTKCDFASVAALGNLAFHRRSAETAIGKPSRRREGSAAAREGQRPDARRLERNTIETVPRPCFSARCGSRPGRLGPDADFPSCPRLCFARRGVTSFISTKGERVVLLFVSE